MAQLFYASRLNLHTFELLCESVKLTIFAGGELDKSSFDKLELNEEQFDIDDARACFAAINYIVSNTCLFQVEGQTLTAELEQLGLPSEHSQLLSKMLAVNADQLRNCLAACEPQQVMDH